MTTPIKEIPHIVEDLRRCYRKKERTLDDRKKQLRGVLRLIEVSSFCFRDEYEKNVITLSETALFKRSGEHV